MVILWIKSRNKRNIVLGVGKWKHLILHLFFFFKEINSGRSFHVPEDCQHVLRYWTSTLERFFYFKVKVFPLHGLPFRLRVIVVNICLAHFAWFALLSHGKLYILLYSMYSELYFIVFNKQYEIIIKW